MKLLLAFTVVALTSLSAATRLLVTGVDSAPQSVT